MAVSEELVNKYSNVALGHVNCTLKELRRLFLVEDLVDSLKVGTFFRWKSMANSIYRSALLFWYS